ncbi:unnamed protein product [Arctogadus glacialis]
MRHDNILGFIAADIKGTGSWTQLLPDHMTYHERTLVLRLPRSTRWTARAAQAGTPPSRASANLHTEIYGTQGKPAIAHRDLKSRTSCFENPRWCKPNDQVLSAPLSLAIQRGGHHQPAGGHKRYMPPRHRGGLPAALLDLVPGDPSYEDMREVVCIKKQETLLRQPLEQRRVFTAGGQADVRVLGSQPGLPPDALRVKKTLVKMLESQDIKL